MKTSFDAALQSVVYGNLCEKVLKLVFSVKLCNYSRMSVTSKKIEYAYDTIKSVEYYIFIYLMSAIGLLIGFTAFCLCWKMYRHRPRSESQSETVQSDLELQNTGV